MPGPSRFPIVTGAVIVAALLLSPSAPAAVPSAANSTLPTCVVASPDGTFLSTVIVRDLAGNPVSGSTVVLDFSTCGVFLPCTFPCVGCTAHLPTQTIRKAADVAGVASFDLRMGGACPNERVAISADGVLLGTAAYSTLDQNGDLSVTGADLLGIQNAMVSGDLSADLDCSGTVDVADLAVAQAHLGVTCNGVVPSARRSWGTIKGAYR